MRDRSHLGTLSNKISLFTSSSWANRGSFECGFSISLNPFLDLLMWAQIPQHHLFCKDLISYLRSRKWNNVIVRGNGSYSAFTKEKRDAAFRKPERWKKGGGKGAWWSDVNIDKANPVMWIPRSCTITEWSPFIWFSFSGFRHLQVNY